MRTNVAITIPNANRGFTLIELMVSVVLGLLIIAAVTQLLISSQTSTMSQQAGSDIQSDGIFGLGIMKKSIRSMNYGAFAASSSRFILNNKTPAGGLVLTVASNATDKLESNFLPIIATTKTVMRKNLNSSELIDKTNLKANSGTLKSDQLVIQRKVVKDTFDCEGNQVRAGFYLVERYFLKEDGSATDLGLACSAVSYGVENKVTPTGSSTATTRIDPVIDDKEELEKVFAVVGGNNKIKGDGTILINRVEHFHFLIGVENGNDVVNAPNNSKVIFMKAADYMNPSLTPKPDIASIRFGLVVRSANPTRSGAKNSDQTFDVLDQTGLKLKPAVVSKSQYQRQVYESTVLIRNARGS